MTIPRGATVGAALEAMREWPRPTGLKVGDKSEVKTTTLGALAQAIIERLTELQCDKILGLTKGCKWPFTP
jgi:hypothetical protein